MSDDDDDVPVGSLSKRSRKLNDDGVNDEASEGTASVPATPVLGPTSGKDTEEVREVTKGVKEVELEDKETTQAQAEDVVEETNPTTADEQTPVSSAEQEAEGEDEDAPAEEDEETEEAAVFDGSTEEKTVKEVPSSEDASENDVEGKPTLASTLEDVTNSPAPKSKALDTDKAQIPTDEATVTSEAPLSSEDAPSSPETPAKLQ